MSSVACTIAEGASCVWRCSFLIFGRPFGTSDTVQLAAFIMISTTVRKLLIRYFRHRQLHVCVQFDE